MSLTPETILVAVGIFLALWYFGASVFNRRRGIAIYRWLLAGLDRLGDQVEGRWLGSSGSGARLNVHSANPPFKSAELIYLLASRELLPLFVVNLLRGRRDQLIVKATLRGRTMGEVEVAPAGSSLARQMRAEAERPWQLTSGPHDLLIGARGTGADAQQAALMPFVERYGPFVRRISWSRKAPQLIVTLSSLTGLYEKGGSAAALYDDLAAVAEAADPSA
jgi:hypothetical protein